MSGFVISSKRDDISVLQINNPQVNALSPGVPDAILAALRMACADATVKAIVVAGAGRTFIAGADIRELEAAAWGKADLLDLHAFLQELEQCPKPVVMAIHGTALGGGLEVAMAGDSRVAVATALLGQPEVNLGLIPGAEGTQRLTRLVGVETAIRMCVSGKPISAADALACGLIDAIVEGDLIGGAVAIARKAVKRMSSQLKEKLESKPGFYEAGRALSAKIRPGQTAPLRAVEAIEAAATMSFEEGVIRERELFTECIQGEQAKAMIHIFFAERAAAKVPGPTGGKPLPIDTESGRLVQIVETLDTRPEDIAATVTLARRLGKVAVVVKGRAIVPKGDLNEAIAEGNKAVEDGRVARASDIDLIYVHSGAFPIWRGGPMFQAKLMDLVG